MDVVDSPADSPKGPPPSTLSRTIYGLSALGLFADALRVYFWAGGGALLAVLVWGSLERRARRRWPLFFLAVLGTALGMALDMILDAGLEGISSDPISFLIVLCISSFFVGGLLIGSGAWIMTDRALPGATTRGSIPGGAFLLVIVTLLWNGIGEFRSTFIPQSADDIRLEAPEALVSVARDFIEQHRDSVRAGGIRITLGIGDVPVELRVDGLRYIVLSSSHIGLVFFRGPDCEYGVRIWSDDAATVHEDEPTRYSDVYVYRWCDEVSGSPRNIP